MRMNFPGGHNPVRLVSTAPDPAEHEYMIVARRMASGSYSFGVRVVRIKPFSIESLQLGALRSGNVAADTPHSALIWAASLLAVDGECIRRLG